MKGYKEPRGAKRWRLRIHLGKRADGSRNTYSETFAGGSREADRRLAVLITELEELASERRRCTLEQLVTEWDEVVAPSLSRSTRANYHRNLRNHVLPYLGNRPVASITTAELERRYRELEEAGAAPATVHQVHSVISALLSTAQRWGWIDHNVAHATKRTSIPWQPPRVTDATGAELARVVGSITDDAFRTVVLLALGTGARRGELLALRWSDLDLEAGNVRITRSIGVDVGGVYEKDTKNHQARTLELDGATVAMLRRHRATTIEWALEAGIGFNPEGYVFSLDPAGRAPWSPNRITWGWRQACWRAGVQGVRFHDLRHYHATELVELAPEDLARARDRLGHRDLSTTNRYAHGRSSADRRLADAAGARLEALGMYDHG